MGILILAEVLLIALFAFVFYAVSISLSLEKGKLCRTLLFVFSVVGVLLCIASAVSFNVSLAAIDADASTKDVIKDSFELFLITDGAYIALGLVITLVSSLLKSRMRAVIPFVLPLWAGISCFWTYLYTVWSEFLGFSSTLYILMFGIGASFLLSFAALPDVQRRIALLSVPSNVESIKIQREGKRKYREDKKKERVRIARLKKKMKNPKR